MGKLAGIFAGLAILISCLGLFGLVAYVAEQRTREIGIRKVLGASVSQVWMLLSKDFLLLVVISCVIASPIALYFLHNWLQQYDYRISIGPGVFVLAAAAAILITLLTVSFQAIRAALANPVESLRRMSQGAILWSFPSQLHRRIFGQTAAEEHLIPVLPVRHDHQRGIGRDAAQVLRKHTHFRQFPGAVKMQVYIKGLGLQTLMA